jgi:hypothetical protein
MSVEQITYARRHPDGDHYTEWRFHLDSGEIVTAALGTHEPHPTEPGRWRYARLDFADGSFIERIGTPVDLWLVNARAAFGTLTDAAEHAIGGPPRPGGPR